MMQYSKHRIFSMSITEKDTTELNRLLKIHINVMGKKFMYNLS